MDMNPMMSAGIAPDKAQAMGALQARLVQLQKQGMPMNQISQVIQQEVQMNPNGVDIKALYPLLQYLKSHPAMVQPPTQDTTAKRMAMQVLAADQQGHAPIAGGPPQLAPPQGNAPPQQGGAPSPPMGGPPHPTTPGAMQGLAGLPAPNIGQHYNTGGIVAFDEGGQTKQGENENTYWNAVKGRISEIMGTHHVGQGIAEKGAQQVSGRKKQIDDAVDQASMASGGIVAFDTGGDIQNALSSMNQNAYMSQARAAMAAQQSQQDAAQRQQGLASLTQSEKANTYSAKRGGRVAHFADGGDTAFIDDPEGGPGTKQSALHIAALENARPSLLRQGIGAINSGIDSLGDAPRSFSPTDEGLAALRTRPAVLNAPPPATPTATAGGPKIDLANSNFMTNGAVNDPRRSTPAVPVPGAGPNVNTTNRASMSGPAFGDARMKVLDAQQQALQTEQDAMLKKYQPETIRQTYDQLTDIAKEQGIGAAAEAYKKTLDERQQLTDKMFKQGKWLDLAQAGFAIAEAATTNPHGGFLGALAVGGAKGAQAFTQTLKDYRDQNAKLADMRYAVAESQEKMLTDRSHEARQIYDNNVNRWERMYAQVTDTRQKVIGTQVTAIENQRMRDATLKAAAISRPTAYSTEAEAYRTANQYPVGSPQYKDALQRYADIKAAGPQVQSATLHQQAGWEQAVERLKGTQGYQLLQAQAYRPLPDPADDPEKYNTALKRQQAAREQIDAMVQREVAGAQGGGGAYPSAVNTLLDKYAPR